MTTVEQWKALIERSRIGENAAYQVSVPIMNLLIDDMEQRDARIAELEAQLEQAKRGVR